jgi:hypothetical protein
MAEESQKQGAASTDEGSTLGSEEAAILALSGGQLVQAEQPKEALPDPADDAEEVIVEDQDVTVDDDDEADPDPKDDAPELVEVEYEGETVKVPVKVKDALLRQSDYSRKMNELGEKEKLTRTAVERAELITSGLEKIAEAKAQAVIANADVEFYEKQDWGEMIANDPRSYARMQASYNQALVARDKALLAAQNVEAELSQAKRASIDDARNAMMTTLQKDLKGWGDELGAKITRYAMSQGYSQADLQTLTDPKVVIALDKARRFDELQAARVALKAKGQDAPKVVKPGSTQRVSGKQAIEARFKKTPTEEDAIRLLN